MKKKLTVFSLLLCLALAVIGIGVTAFADTAADTGGGTTAEEAEVKSYALTFAGGNPAPIAIYNKTQVKAGAKVIMEYTVYSKSLPANTAIGFVSFDESDFASSAFVYNVWGCADLAVSIPDQVNWLDATTSNYATTTHYKVEFCESAAGEFEYKVSKATKSKLGDEWSNYTDVDVSGNLTQKLGTRNVDKNYGIWVQNDNVNIRFLDVKFYDENGKDLGVTSNVGFHINDYTVDPEYKGTSSYTVDITPGEGTSQLYLTNSTKSSWTAGDRMVMEYTVEEGDYTYTKSGFMTASNPDKVIGATGSLYYKLYYQENAKSALFEKGATYKIVFTFGGIFGSTSAADRNYSAKITKTAADGTVTELPEYTLTAANNQNINGHIGLWHESGDLTHIKLINAKFYDENGADLGFKFNSPNGNNATVTEYIPIENYDEITFKSALHEQFYDVNFKGDGMYVHNEVALDGKAGDKFYMDWKAVAAAPDDGSIPFGIICTAVPDKQYPYQVTGTMAQSNSASWFKVGCSYHAQIEIKNNGFDIMIEETDANGEVSSVTKHVAAWVCEGGVGGELATGGYVGIFIWAKNVDVTAQMRIYNAEGENLGCKWNGFGAGESKATVTEQAYAVTYMQGNTDITESIDEKFRTYTTGKGITQLPEVNDSANKQYVSGWYTDADLTNRCTKVERFTSNTPITLYAKMDKYRYFIEFDPNDGNGDMDGLELTYDQSAALPKCDFTRTGYEFLGWSEVYDAEQPAYTDGATVSGLTENNNYYITLYAIWKIKNYTVTYELNGGVNGDNPATYTVNDEITLKDAAKEGFTFDGWYTNANFSGSKVTALSGSSDVTLYAKFTSDSSAEPTKPATTKKKCGGDLSAAPFTGLGLLLMGFAAVLIKRKRSGN